MNIDNIQQRLVEVIDQVYRNDEQWYLVSPHVDYGAHESVDDIQLKMMVIESKDNAEFYYSYIPEEHKTIVEKQDKNLANEFIKNEYDVNEFMQQDRHFCMQILLSYLAKVYEYRFENI